MYSAPSLTISERIVGSDLKGKKAQATSSRNAAIMKPKIGPTNTPAPKQSMAQKDTTASDTRRAFPHSRLHRTCRHIPQVTAPKVAVSAARNKINRKSMTSSKPRTRNANMITTRWAAEPQYRAVAGKRRKSATMTPSTMQSPCFFHRWPARYIPATAATAPAMAGKMTAAMLIPSHWCTGKAKKGSASSSQRPQLCTSGPATKATHAAHFGATTVPTPASHAIVVCDTSAAIQ
mmetsp:Transcript_101055/g.216464  ORF Transcript_101055/g.216464 Transcript_101055/m.216464 type:complete len:234 (-) Transcript_101055:98-799(-)